MDLLTPEQCASLKEGLLPARPGPLIGMHILHTGHGSIFADKWPHPAALMMEVADNYSFTGDAVRFEPAELRGRVAGFVEAPGPFAALLRKTFPDAVAWPRLIFALHRLVAQAIPDGAVVRRLTEADASRLQALSPECKWISKTWGGPVGLAGSGFAWGGMVASRLAAVACTYFVGQPFEELGVVTEPAHKGLGLSDAWAFGLCRDILARGRTPGWSMSPHNLPSVRVAKKLGFRLERRETLYVVGVAVPKPAFRL